VGFLPLHAIFMLAMKTLGPSPLGLVVAEARQEPKSRQAAQQLLHTHQPLLEGDLVAMVGQHHSAPTSLLLEGSAAVHLVLEETQTLTEQHSALVELRVA
jgi:hypothetical protein